MIEFFSRTVVTSLFLISNLLSSSFSLPFKTWSRNFDSFFAKVAKKCTLLDCGNAGPFWTYCALLVNTTTLQRWPINSSGRGKNAHEWKRKQKRGLQRLLLDFCACLGTFDTLWQGGLFYLRWGVCKLPTNNWSFLVINNFPRIIFFRTDYFDAICFRCGTIIQEKIHCRKETSPGSLLRIAHHVTHLYFC